MPHHCMYKFIFRRKTFYLVLMLIFLGILYNHRNSICIIRNITQLTNHQRIMDEIVDRMRVLYSTSIEDSSVYIVDNSELDSEVHQNKPHINHNTVNTVSIHKWNHCLNSIQKRILQAFSDKFTDKSLIKYPVLLVGPAYHGNVGDNMLNYGELVLMEYFSRNNTECGVAQSARKIVDCGNFEKFKNNSLALWHAGWNWGDVWVLNIHRIKSFLPMLQKNMTIIGMPQSLHYNNNDLKQKEAENLKKIIEQTIGTVQSKHQIILTWRQENSYNEALHLYPFVDNRLVPDIAFMIDPIKNTKYWTIPSTNEVDLLFVLRIDKESMVIPERRNDAIQNIIDDIQSTNDNITFRIVDWVDREEFYQPTVAATPMQQLNYKGAFDYNSHFASAFSLFSSGKVVITDRLHGSIFAFLSLKPHVFIDQMYEQIQRTRAVAFNSSTECQDEQALMYTQALDMKDAVKKAMHMLERYRFT